jgi:ribA/ribD-fused uncharacterized protein
MIIDKDGNKLPTVNDNCILGFFGEYRFLSNFHVCHINFDGKEFSSSEAAYMYCKTNIPAEKELFVGVLSPKKVKILGQTVTLRDDWETDKVFYMTKILYAKFSQHESLKALLKATGTRHLEETNDWGDLFWGVDTEGRGKNMLGKCLMFVRDVL